MLDKEKDRLAWEEGKLKRQEERKLRIEENEAKEAAWHKAEDDYYKEEEEKQLKWENEQLNKLDINPYTYEIDILDFLYKYCQKQDQIHNGRLF